jgi:hypothetical protein
VNLVTFGEEQLGEISSILTGNSCDQGSLQTSGLLIAECVDCVCFVRNSNERTVGARANYQYFIFMMLSPRVFGNQPKVVLVTGYRPTIMVTKLSTAGMGISESGILSG